LIVSTLDDNKAEDIVIVPLEGKSTIADYMIIATGNSSRHVVGLAEKISSEIGKQNKSVRFEGRASGDWVIADAGDIIVHLFRPEVRSFYNLEKIWSAPEFARVQQAHI
jgi:ribosome-associated protein